MACGMVSKRVDEGARMEAYRMAFEEFLRCRKDFYGALDKEENPNG
jgi:hypothetical protein